MRLPVCLALLSCAVSSPGSAQQLPSPRDARPIHAYLALPRVGSTVPAFRYELLTGGSVSPATLRGAPTVLVLWATWCGASRRVLAEVGALHERYGPQGVHVVILAADSVADLRRVRDSAGVRTPMAVAPSIMDVFDLSASAPERDSLRVSFALPSVLVLDAAGHVIWRDVGPNSFGRIRDLLNQHVPTTGNR